MLKQSKKIARIQFDSKKNEAKFVRNGVQIYLVIKIYLDSVKIIDKVKVEDIIFKYLDIIKRFM